MGEGGWVRVWVWVRVRVRVRCFVWFQWREAEVGTCKRGWLGLGAPTKC